MPLNAHCASIVRVLCVNYWFPERPLATDMKIRIKVQPRSARDELKPFEQEEWKLCLRAPPVGGKANEACVAFFAQGLGIPRTRVHIVTGHNSRLKLIELEGVEREEFLAWVKKILRSASKKERPGH